MGPTIRNYAAIENWTLDRYQIVVAFRTTENSDGPGQSSSAFGHGLANADFEDNFKGIWVDAVDLRPWEEVEHYSSRDDNWDASTSSEGDVMLHTEAPTYEPRVVESRPLYCLTHEHDPAQAYGVQCVRAIGENTASARSFEIAAGWLASCLSSAEPPKHGEWRLRSTHLLYDEEEECWGAEDVSGSGDVVALPAQRPGRLIELGPGAAPTRLIHTEDREYRYAALSYCWGKAPPGDARPWQTTLATVEKHLDSIDRTRLPQTLQDAVSICERLHIGYLWIDSICIIQDSPTDWATEAAKMSGIYLGSLLTISLPGTPSSEAGCFNRASQHTTSRPDFRQQWIPLDSTLQDGRRSRLYLPRSATRNSQVSALYDDEVERGVLGGRAWVLQEHILPRRTLYVTPRQLLWECGHCRLGEDGYPQPQTNWLYPISGLGIVLGSRAVVEMWYKVVVENYTRRQITYESDRLVAISALARATYLNRHVGYVAGLWRDCIVPGLLWKRDGRGAKSAVFSCPSWSWASQSGPVSYECAVPDYFTPEASEGFPMVKDVVWETAPENPFGDVRFAHVDVETKIALGTVTKEEVSFERWAGKEGGHRLVIPGLSHDVAAIKNVAVMDDETASGQDVVVALMGHCFILLRPPDLTSQDHRRVGFAMLDRDRGFRKMDYFARHWAQRTIRLM
ncbi:hypothetical protein C8034_v011563 [Colletotrichum sidae]|uniref:Heterokaryon incompatibility domain-containing protein n=1 Tax=Colletotrichum sidae TaxID=1347389 RepID=A0A4R8TG12_9PEZI|nr:hypothetical protein C8034_v011563 [Colletotrichum sidae]